MLEASSFFMACRCFSVKRFWLVEICRHPLGRSMKRAPSVEPCLLHHGQRGLATTVKASSPQPCSCKSCFSFSASLGIPYRGLQQIMKWRVSPLGRQVVVPAACRTIWTTSRMNVGTHVTETDRWASKKTAFLGGHLPVEHPRRHAVDRSRCCSGRHADVNGHSAEHGVGGVQVAGGVAASVPFL